MFSSKGRNYVSLCMHIKRSVLNSRILWDLLECRPVMFCKFEAPPCRFIDSGFKRPLRIFLTVILKALWDFFD